MEPEGTPYLGYAVMAIGALWLLIALVRAGKRSASRGESVAGALLGTWWESRDDDRDGKDHDSYGGDGDGGGGGDSGGGGGGGSGDGGGGGD